MVLEYSSNHKSHHHHHHRDSMKEFQVSYVTEELMQVFEHADLRRKKSEKMGRREAAKEKKDVDKEAEDFIKFEHSKFSNTTDMWRLNSHYGSMARQDALTHLFCFSSLSFIVLAKVI
ncbi:hypothetical protein F2Q70_00030704 [Brassica cretica]|uniref:Uncharacterized protein n=1 Tax=Brassica cretica TaxID=69181 RepID=A0A3N6QJJ5_BRACR|nr:hypothetical protein F2Q70_00030704 [Brassica cretica]KAF2553434.1 hypothetical protein F2Q68_00035123 [Brassica cretica]